MGPEVLAGVLQRQNHFHNNAVMLFDLNFFCKKEKFKIRVAGRFGKSGTSPSLTFFFSEHLVKILLILRDRLSKIQ